MSYPSSPFPPYPTGYYPPVPPPPVLAVPPPWAYWPPPLRVRVPVRRPRWALVLILAPLWLPVVWVAVCLVALAAPILVPGGIGALVIMAATKRQPSNADRRRARRAHHRRSR